MKSVLSLLYLWFEKLSATYPKVSNNFNAILGFTFSYEVLYGEKFSDYCLSSGLPFLWLYSSGEKTIAFRLDCGCQSWCIIVLANWHCLLPTVDIYIGSYWMVRELKMSRFRKIELIFWSETLGSSLRLVKLHENAFVLFLASFTLHDFHLCNFMCYLITPARPAYVFVSIICKQLQL